MSVGSRMHDDYLYMSPELERGREGFGLRRRRDRHSPPAEMIIDKHTRRSRGKHGEEEEHEWEVEIDRSRHRPRHHRLHHDELYLTRPRRHRSLPRPVEREEIVISREESPRRVTEREELIVRHETDAASEASYHVEPNPIRAPPIHQEVVTHHRHIDHGYSSVPPPRRREASRRRDIEEIDIKRRHRESRDFDATRETDLEVSIRHKEDSREGGRSHPTLAIREHPRDSRDEEDIRHEAEFYNRRTMGRAQMGEAYNGATRDWNILDVPPGTKRVTMDGIGGASQEVTWQRYNGVRRSKFIPETEERGSDRLHKREHDRDFEKGRGSVGRRFVGVKDRKDELWTEITKDLVVPEAIETLGYAYEETPNFFYIFDYLHYDDVAELVDLSEDVRRRRRDRIREIQRERSIPPVTALPIPPGPPPISKALPERPTRAYWDEDRVRETEIIFDDHYHRRRRSRHRSPTTVDIRW
ncbi:hypothetical protein FQN57_007210 [Myotisia sp. PD_48]|nr:hypothetical protein FQN57_007210 [Myotisia sp. PD_48]